MSRNLSATQKRVRKAVSPLLGKLMAAEAEPNPLLLKPYVALDALYRGRGSSGAVTMLGQHLIISEQLCLAGFERAQLGPVRQAHAALVRIDGHAKVGDTWIAEGQDYEALRNALQVYERQLRIAPPTEVRIAQTVMVTMLTGRDVAAAGI
ncbi:hypothetical protein BZM27_24440 [Paraburkholderia steynii]|uniref:Uncharacterized protein n=1 Tax=Paraburkholderia steynii TaxID=1245441 RepID=A0A4R0XK73_9BURK|nr:hypothetical protein BZM27_24440 [Paraburkholderia steynii]